MHRVCCHLLLSGRLLYQQALSIYRPSHTLVSTTRLCCSGAEAPFALDQATFTGARPLNFCAPVSHRSPARFQHTAVVLRHPSPWTWRPSLAPPLPPSASWHPSSSPAPCPTPSAGKPHSTCFWEYVAQSCSWRLVVSPPLALHHRGFPAPCPASSGAGAQDRAYSLRVYACNTACSHSSSGPSALWASSQFKPPPTNLAGRSRCSTPPSPPPPLARSPRWVGGWAATTAFGCNHCMCRVAVVARLLTARQSASCFELRSHLPTSARSPVQKRKEEYALGAG